MITADIKIDYNGQNLYFSEYDNYDELLQDLTEMFGYREDLYETVIEHAELLNYTFNIGGVCLEDLYDTVKNLEKYNEGEQDIILTYFEDFQNDFVINDCEMTQAFDEYYGSFDSDRDAAYEVLREIIGMNHAEAIYVLDTLEATDKVIETTFEVVSRGKYYFA